MLVAHLLWCNFQITIFESDVSGEFSEAFASGLFVGIDDSTTEKATSVVVSAKLIDKLVARTVIPDVTQQPCQYGSWMMSAVKAKRLEFGSFVLKMKRSMCSGNSGTIINPAS